MKYKIGIFGSAEGNFEAIRRKVHSLADELAKHNVILITGASTKGSAKVIFSQSPKKLVKAIIQELRIRK